MIGPTFSNMNGLIVASFINGVIDPMRNSFDKYYIPLVEMKEFKVLIENKHFFDQFEKKIKNRMRKIQKCQETMIIQQKTY